MANRSKKVVISARIEPYLKAALDTAAAARNEKIVKVLETVIEEGLNEMFVPNPFQGGSLEGGEINFMAAFEAIWSEDEVLFKLRSGAMGPRFSGETLWRQASVVVTSEYFKGDYDLYGDLNGYAKKLSATCKKYLVNLDLVRGEWPLIEGYISFLDANKNLSPSYEAYKKILEASDSK